MVEKKQKKKEKDESKSKDEGDEEEEEEEVNDVNMDEDNGPRGQKRSIDEEEIDDLSTIAKKAKGNEDQEEQSTAEELSQP